MNWQKPRAKASFTSRNTKEHPMVLVWGGIAFLAILLVCAVGSVYGDNIQNSAVYKVAKVWGDRFVMIPILLLGASLALYLPGQIMPRRQQFDFESFIFVSLAPCNVLSNIVRKIPDRLLPYKPLILQFTECGMQ
jgi:hypothetical protein